MASYLDVNSMSICDPLCFSIPLPLAIHATAQRFCQPQWSSQKTKQVYLNTLAVYAVDAYLTCLGVDTVLEQGNSWDPFMQSLTDTADLVIVNQGQKKRLECRPVLSTASMCRVPPEVWDQRLGYVAVQLDDDLCYAKLLGFLPQVNEMDVPLYQWRSLDMLIQSVTTQSTVTTLLSEEGQPLNTLPNPQLEPLFVQSLEPKQTVGHLTEWLKGNVEEGWKQLQELTLPENLRALTQPTLQFRSAITPLAQDRGAMRTTVRGKYLDWQLPTGEQKNLVLVVGVMPTQRSDMNIWVKLCPQQSSTYLPSKLDLVVLDEQNIAVMQAQSRQTEMIQLKFGGKIGEKFSIKISLNESSQIESFVV